MRMNSLLLALMLSLSSAVYATSTQDHTCQGGHNCNTTTTTSNPTTVNNTNQNTNNNNNQNVNTNVNNIDNRNNNTNTVNTNVTNTNNLNNRQDQRQQQQQQQNQSINNSGNSQSNSSSSSNSTSTSNSNSQSNSSSNSTSNVTNSGNSTNTLSNNSQSSSSADNSGNNVGNSSNAISIDASHNTKEAVRSAYAPTVVTGSDQCLVPVTVGAQGFTFGASFGVAYRDHVCEQIKLSRELHNMGFKKVALYLLAQDERVDRAIKDAQNNVLDRGNKPRAMNEYDGINIEKFTKINPEPVSFDTKFFSHQYDIRH